MAKVTGDVYPKFFIGRGDDSDRGVILFVKAAEESELLPVRDCGPTWQMWCDRVGAIGVNPLEKLPVDLWNP